MSNTPRAGQAEGGQPSVPASEELPGEGSCPMAERYIAPEVSEWLGRLRAALPAAAGRQDGTRLDRAGLIDEIGGSFAHLMSTGPDYSRAVTEYVQDAVRYFSQGNGDQAQAALRRAHDAVPGQTDSPASETGVNDA